MYYDELQAQKTMLESLMLNLKQKPLESSDSRLRICLRPNRPTQFYLITKRGDSIGTYIKKEDMAIAARIADRDYRVALLEEAERELALLDRFLRSYHPEKLYQVYDDMHPERKKLVKPPVLSDREYAEQWLSAEYQGNTRDGLDCSELNIKGPLHIIDMQGWLYYSEQVAFFDFMWLLYSR